MPTTRARARLCRNGMKCDKLRLMRRLLLALVGLALFVLALVAAGRGGLAAPPLDPSTWGRWAAARSPAAAAMAIVRLAALVLAGYLFVVTVVGTALRLLDAGRAVSVADALTVPWVRRAVHAAVTAGLAGSSLALVAAGRPAPLGHTIADVEVNAPPILQRADSSPVVEPAVPVPAVGAATPAREPTWTVGPGDHLWSIAERTLAEAWGRPPTDPELGTYWRAVVEENRLRLADPANPDLVFPGQVLVVPAPPRRP
jgi:hypothetical protein